MGDPGRSRSTPAGETAIHSAPPSRYGTLLAALMPAHAHISLARWLTDDQGLDPDLVQAAGLRGATVAMALAAYRAVGLNEEQAPGLGLPGPAELQGQGSPTKPKAPFQPFGQGGHATLVVPFHDGQGRVVDLATLAPPRGRRRQVLHFGLRGGYDTRPARVLYGLWDRKRITASSTVILTEGILAQLQLAQSGQAALATRPGHDWCPAYRAFLHDKTVRLAYPNDEQGRQTTQRRLQALAQMGLGTQVLDPAWYGACRTVAERLRDWHVHGHADTWPEDLWLDGKTWQQRCQQRVATRRDQSRRQRGPTALQLRQLTRPGALQVWLAARTAWEEAGFDRKNAGRLALSLNELERRTGLTRPTVLAGLRQAQRWGLVKTAPEAEQIPGGATIYRHITPVPDGWTPQGLTELGDWAVVKCALAVALDDTLTSISALARRTNLGWRLARRGWDWLQRAKCRAVQPAGKEIAEPRATGDKEIAQPGDSAAKPAITTLQPGPRTSSQAAPRPEDNMAEHARAFVQNDSVESMESLDSMTTGDPSPAATDRDLQLLLSEIGVQPSLTEKILATHSRETVKRHVQDTLAFAPENAWSWCLTSLREKRPSVDRALVRACRTLGLSAGMTLELVSSQPARVRQQLAWLPQRGPLRNPPGYLVAAVYEDRPAPEDENTAPDALEQRLGVMNLRPRQIRRLRARCPDAELDHWLHELEAFGQQAEAGRFLDRATRGAWRPIPEADLELVGQCRAVGVEPRMTRKLVLTWPARVRQQLEWLPLRQVRREQAAGTLVKAVYRDRPAPRLRPDRPEAKPVAMPDENMPAAPIVPEITDPVMQVLRGWWPRLCPLWRVSRATVQREGDRAVLQVTVPHGFGRRVLEEGHWQLCRPLQERYLPSALEELAPGATHHDLQVTVDPALVVDLDWPTLAVDIGDSVESAELGDWLACCGVQWEDERTTWRLTVPDDLTIDERSAILLGLHLRLAQDGYLEVTVDENLRTRAEKAELVTELTEAMEERGMDARGTARLVGRQVARYGLDYVQEKLSVILRIRHLRNPLGAWYQACVEDWR